MNNDPKYRQAIIDFLGKETLNYLRSLKEDELILAWETFAYGNRLGMQVRNHLRKKFPEIDEQFDKYVRFEIWSWDLIKDIINELPEED